MDDLDSPFSVPKTNPRLQELQRKKGECGTLSDEEDAECVGLFAFPDNPRGAELRKKEVLAAKGLAEMSEPETEELRQLFKAKFSATLSRFPLGRETARPTPTTPSERRIADIISKIDPSDHDTLWGQLHTLAAALENPAAAKRDWLCRIYRQRGWLDEEQAAMIAGEIPDRALAMLEEVCKEKANIRKEVEPLRLSLPAAGSPLSPYVREQLAAHGIDPERCRVRYLEKAEYAHHAVAHGSDRTDSKIDAYYHHGGYDGEELAMIRNGLTDARDTSYLSSMSHWDKATVFPGRVYLVYAADAVEGIGPCGYMKSNGFHAFHFGGDIKRRSLLAVFS